MQKEDPELLYKALDAAERGRHIIANPSIRISDDEVLEVPTTDDGHQYPQVRGCAPDPPGPFDDPEPMPEVELNGPASASEPINDAVLFERAIRRAARDLADAVLLYLDRRPDAGVLLHARLMGSDGRCVELLAHEPDEVELIPAQDGVFIDGEGEGC